MQGSRSEIGKKEKLKQGCILGDRWTSAAHPSRAFWGALQNRPQNCPPKDKTRKYLSNTLWPHWARVVLLMLNSLQFQITKAVGLGDIPTWVSAAPRQDSHCRTLSISEALWDDTCTSRSTLAWICLLGP